MVIVMVMVMVIVIVIVIVILGVLAAVALPKFVNRQRRRPCCCPQPRNSSSLPVIAL
jgi:hypothetical protein